MSNNHFSIDAVLSQDYYDGRLDEENLAKLNTKVKHCFQVTLSPRTTGCVAELKNAVGRIAYEFLPKEDLEHRVHLAYRHNVTGREVKVISDTDGTTALSDGSTDNTGHVRLFVTLDPEAYAYGLVNIRYWQFFPKEMQVGSPLTSEIRATGIAPTLGEMSMDALWTPVLHHHVRGFFHKEADYEDWYTDIKTDKHVQDILRWQHRSCWDVYVVIHEQFSHATMQDSKRSCTK